MFKRAVILAGGLGTRLRPYSFSLPKPLMPVGEFPILEIIVRQLVFFGFSHITMAVNHQAEIIKAYFQDGERWGASIDYSLEVQALGTIAPLSLISDLPENFLVMNGDVLTDLNYLELFDAHASSKNIFTIASYSRDQKVDYGVLEINSHGQLIGFYEKPVSTYLVSMGVYVANRKIAEFIPKDQKYGFDDLMLDLIKAGKPAWINEHRGYWLDIGRPEDYIKATEEFEEMKERFLRV